MSFMETKDNWDAGMYDESHSFVSKYGESLIDLLSPKKGEYILDVGCGTGDLAYSLYEYGCRVIGIDKSSNMVQSARLKYPAISFHVKDVLEIDFNEEFDAVFSNATLHWVTHPKAALQTIFDSLKFGGRFVAEFGGKGNVETITEEMRKQFEKAGLQYKSPWYYPSIGQYTMLMEEIGFNVTLAVHFERPTLLAGAQGLSNWIEMFGKELFDSLPSEGKDNIITNVEAQLRNSLFNGNHWTADYKRIRVVGWKEK